GERLRSEGEDGEVLVEESVLSQVVQRRQELAPREVATAAEDHEQAGRSWAGRCVVAERSAHGSAPLTRRGVRGNPALPALSAPGRSARSGRSRRATRRASARDPPAGTRGAGAAARPTPHRRPRPEPRIPPRDAA